MRIPAPTSVFASSGRFAYYMIVVAILAVGAQAYLLLTRRRRAAWGFLGIGVALVGAMQSASRGSILYTLMSIFVLSAGFLWGAPWKWGQGHRLVKAIRRSLLIGGIGMFLMVQFFPTAIGANWAFYSETLVRAVPPHSCSSGRWNIRWRICEKCLRMRRWPSDYGTGTASSACSTSPSCCEQPPHILGRKRVGSSHLEMGIIAPFLWLFWAATLLFFGWKVVKQLRQTVYFPVGLAILWYAFLLLFPFTHAGMQPYQNYVMNAYFWFLIGVLFRLPHLARTPQVFRRRLRVSGRARSSGLLEESLVEYVRNRRSGHEKFGGVVPGGRSAHGRCHVASRSR